MSDNHEHVGRLRIVDSARLRTLGLDTGLGTSGIAALFIEQMADQLEDLRAAILAGSEGMLTAVAHRCVGSSALGGMEQLSALLRSLERDPAAGLRDAERCLAAVERAFADVIRELSPLADDSDMADVA